YLVDFLFLFFFSSRRRHTRFSRDWSSDVCSSDLIRFQSGGIAGGDGTGQWPWPARDCRGPWRQGRNRQVATQVAVLQGRREQARSEERRVGKECRSRGEP